MEENKKKNNTIKVPYSINLIKKCVEFKINSYYFMNFRDLEYLTTVLEIGKVEKYIAEINERELNKRGISKVVHIDGAEAMRL